MSQPGIASFDQVDPQDIWRKDRDHFLHPWTHFDSFKKDGSLVMARGEGAYVYDISGKRYLDGIGGLWCVNMGYGREEIVAGHHRPGAPPRLLQSLRRYHQRAGRGTGGQARRDWRPAR